MRQNQMLTTRWDPFEDLRSAHDELDQMSPILARALGHHGQRQGAAIDSVVRIGVPKAEEAKPKLITVRPGHGGVPASSGRATSPS
jgi:hypothetical protein